MWIDSIIITLYIASLYTATKNISNNTYRIRTESYNLSINDNIVLFGENKYIVNNKKYIISSSDELQVKNSLFLLRVDNVNEHFIYIFTDLEDTLVIFTSNNEVPFLKSKQISIIEI